MPLLFLLLTLAMNYDQTLENPMVTKQGGSLKGTVSINNGAGFNHWAGKVEITKPVSRPWVKLKNWIEEPSSVAEKTGDSVSSDSAIPIENDFFFFVGERSWFTAEAYFGDDFKGGRLIVSLKDPSEAEIGGMTDVIVPAKTKEMTLKLWIEGKKQSASFGANSLIFRVVDNGESFRGEEGGNFAGEAKTSVHIKSIEWEAVKENQFFENPNLGGGKGIYADKDTPDDTSKYDRVNVVVKIEPSANGKARIALRAFDVDDPSSNKAPVDDENLTKDNRGTIEVGNNQKYKEGVFTLTKTPQTTITAGDVHSDYDEGKAEFQVTTQPGDNFKVGAVLARDIEKLKKWVAAQSESDPAANDTSAKVLKEDGVKAAEEGKEITELLTVWRRLWVEWDTMAPPPTARNSSEKNFVEGEIESIEQDNPNNPSLSLFKIKLGGEFEGIVALDQSPNLDGTGEAKGSGRFENGKFSINPSADINNEGTFLPVVGNGNDYIKVESPLQFNITNKQCSGVIKEFIKNGQDGSSFFELLIYNTFECPKIEAGDELNIGGLKFTIVSAVQNGVQPNIYEISTAGQAEIKYRLKDDDTEELPDEAEENSQFEHLKEAFDDVYIKPEHADIATRQTNLPFVLNLKKDEQIPYFATKIDDKKVCFETKKHASNNYWVGYVLSAYQADTKLTNYEDEPQKEDLRADNDPNIEGDLRGVNYRGLGAIIFLETQKDVKANSQSNIDVGYYLVAHEIGHQFNLKDEYGENHIMGKDNNQELKFKPEDEDQIRRRSNSPNF